MHEKEGENTGKIDWKEKFAKSIFLICLSARAESPQ